MSNQRDIARHERIAELIPRVPQRLALLLLVFMIGGLRIAPAHALPAACTAPDSFCTAPIITPWRHNSTSGYIGNGGPFDSEADLIAGIITYKTTGPGAWCAFNPTSVTRDDDRTWGFSPWFNGSVDVFHGNTLHAESIGYPWDGCVQQWQNDAPLGQWREVLCLPKQTLIWDTAVAPAVPFCLGSHAANVPSKIFGSHCELRKGNPCDLTHGNKYQAETDYQSSGAGSALLVRSHNSLAAYYRGSVPADGVEAFGIGWTATYFQRLLITSVTVGTTTHETIYAFRPDGRVVNFNRSGASWVRVGEDISDTVTTTPSGYEYRTTNNTIETYDSLGRLITIREHGKSPQTLTYSGGSLRPSQVDNGFGHTLQFTYATIGGKQRVTA